MGSGTSASILFAKKQETHAECSFAFGTLREWLGTSRCLYRAAPRGRAGIYIYSIISSYVVSLLEVVCFEHEVRNQYCRSESVLVIDGDGGVSLDELVAAVDFLVEAVLDVEVVLGLDPDFGVAVDGCLDFLNRFSEKEGLVVDPYIVHVGIYKI